MATGCTIAAHDNVFNKAILNEQGLFFADPNSVQAILDHSPDPAVLAVWKEKNLEKIKMLYNWDKIIDDYEQLLLRDKT